MGFVVHWCCWVYAGKTAVDSYVEAGWKLMVRSSSAEFGKEVAYRNVSLITAVRYGSFSNVV